MPLRFRYRIGEYPGHEYTEGRIRPGPLTARESAQSPTDLVESWLATALKSSSGEGYGSARSGIFEALRSDPTHPIAEHLLALVEHPDPGVRSIVLQLLADLAPLNSRRSALVEAAESCFTDSDMQVRRRAVWLVAAADHDRARHLLLVCSSDCEPVVRLALVEAVIGTRCPHQECPCQVLVQTLMKDSDPAVRLRAGLAFARSASAAELVPTEAALVQDLVAAGARLAGPGSRLRWSAGELWASALVVQDRESDCYRWVAQLLARPEPVCRHAAVEMAHQAIRRWRAAASRLSCPLAAALGDDVAEVGSAAAAVICASLELTGAHADELAELLEVPRFREVVSMALGRIGDRRIHRPPVTESEALAALRREVESGHRECAVDRTGGCSLGQAVTVLIRSFPLSPALRAPR
ncbi:HEAT repeat domain-containing protein [Nocardia stercoris]|uniref:HEAT repeat domain-containing protein n=1 Tax=Nocardia stercoris TaxID=2483361 RepID=UPI001319D9B8|nr:HEAT repeat domain-containing protein [Nocardia stercoris]